MAAQMCVTLRSILNMPPDETVIGTSSLSSMNAS